MSGCTGACCAVFYLSSTKLQLERKLAKGTAVVDGAFILDMIVPLTAAEARERAARFGSTFRPKKRNERHYFTCRHWDEDTRLCTVYEQRPDMCRSYPYGKQCRLAEGCECSDDRVEALP